MKIRLTKVLESLRAFRGATGGQFALIFGLTATVLVMTAGGGIDMMRAYQARQKLSEVAALACQYASRPSVLALTSSTQASTSGGQTYQGAVQSYINAAIVAQQLPWVQTNAAPFTFAQNGPADVTLAAVVPMAFAKIINIQTITVGAKTHCYDAPSQIKPNEEVNKTYAAKEGFESNAGAGIDHGGWKFYPIPGRGLSTPTSYPTTTPVYTGNDGAAWYGTGYCLETDTVGTNSSTVPEGTRSAELDCDNGTGSTGNSAISTNVSLQAGNYELRYNYRSRIDYPNYSPAYICGSAAGDVAWANDRNSQGGPVANALRTNQINVYLDRRATETAPPPLHTTIDGTQQLAGANLIDVCVHSYTWIERSVRIYVQTASNYWLTFAADGQNDSYGGQIDNIRLCLRTCPGTLQDDFPSAWLAANNGGSSNVLFEDSFEAPVYSKDPSATAVYTTGGNLSNSYGMTVACGGGFSPPGWPCQASRGWSVAPYNEAWFWMQGATRGNQYPSLQGSNAFSNASDPLNRAISRPFLLDPGYYNVSYYYTSLMDFSTDFIYGTYCTTAPTTSYNQIFGAGSSYYTTGYGKKSGRLYGDPNVYTQYMSTNIVSAYMSHGQLISTPSISSTLGGAPTYTNPDGTTSSTPSVPPDSGSVFTAYNPAINPVIDTCQYSGGYTWVARSVNVKITKPGVYWLTFSSQGTFVTKSGAGGAIDDVKLTALGSPYMSSPPTAVTIPVPNPQPGSRISFDGYYIIADPFQPTAPAQ